MPESSSRRCCTQLQSALDQTDSWLLTAYSRSPDPHAVARGQAERAIARWLRRPGRVRPGPVGRSACPHDDHPRTTASTANSRHQARHQHVSTRPPPQVRSAQTVTTLGTRKARAVADSSADGGRRVRPPVASSAGWSDAAARWPASPTARNVRRVVGHRHDRRVAPTGEWIMLRRAADWRRCPRVSRSITQPTKVVNSLGSSRSDVQAARAASGSTRSSSVAAYARPAGVPSASTPVELAAYLVGVVADGRPRPVWYASVTGSSVPGEANPTEGERVSRHQLVDGRAEVPLPSLAHPKHASTLSPPRPTPPSLIKRFAP